MLLVCTPVNHVFMLQSFIFMENRVQTFCLLSVCTLSESFRWQNIQCLSNTGVTDMVLNLWNCCQEVLLSCSCAERHKSLRYTTRQSLVQLNYNTDLKKKKKKALHTKSQRCNNSGLKWLFWIVSPCECRSPWEEALAEFTQREEIDQRKGPDSINCLCEEVRRGGRVRVMKMNHYPLEDEILACQLWVEL